MHPTKTSERIKTMHSNLHFFSVLSEPTPGKGLPEAIFSAIAAKKRKAARIELAYIGALLIASFAVLIPALRYVWSELELSGFLSYVLLPLSDSSVLTSSWKDLTWTLAESIPVLGTAFVLSALFAVLVSLRSFLRVMKPAFGKTKAAF